MCVTNNNWSLQKHELRLFETILGHFKNTNLSSQILDMGPDPGFGSSNPGFGSPILKLFQKAWIWIPDPGFGLKSWIWHQILDLDPQVLELISKGVVLDVQLKVLRSPIIPYGMVWCGMVWYGVVWCGMGWYGVV